MGEDPHVQLVEVDPRDVGPDDLLLDVREDDEWAAGRAPGAVHVPLSDFVARLPELPPGRRVAVVCRVGARSAQAALYLASAGVDAVNVAGGMLAWERLGLPVVTDGGPGQVG